MYDTLIIMLISTVLASNLALFGYLLHINSKINTICGGFEEYKKACSIRFENNEENIKMLIAENKVRGY